MDNYKNFFHYLYPFTYYKKHYQNYFNKHNNVTLFCPFYEVKQLTSKKHINNFQDSLLLTFRRGIYTETTNNLDIAMKGSSFFEILICKFINSFTNFLVKQKVIISKDLPRKKYLQMNAEKLKHIFYKYRVKKNVLKLKITKYHMY